jgi:hypothetical protein
VQDTEVRSPCFTAHFIQSDDFNSFAPFSGSMSEPEYFIPNTSDVSPEDIQQNVDLPGAFLWRADLPGADLKDADLSRADLGGADLSGADLGAADLSGAVLRGVDLSEADLRHADLSEAVLAEATLTGVTLSRGTELDPPRDAIEDYKDNFSGYSKSEMEDEIARVNSQLKNAYSVSGLLSQGRKARARTRRARRKEVYAEEGWRSRSWFLSRLSSIFSGYGIKLRPVIGWMMALYFLSAGVYWYAGGMAWDQSLYYSIVTFTTAPPDTPPNYVTSIVAGIETFAGTAAIIFLGYVLGSRERI